MILTRTPLRVSLFGGGTDYPEWFNTHGTEAGVLGFALDKYVYVGVKELPPGQSMQYRVQYSKVDDCARAEDVQHPVVRAALLTYPELQRQSLEFHIFGDLPGRSGMGGSGAFTVGLLNALRYFSPTLASRVTDSYDDDLDPCSLAVEAIQLEREVVKEAVGVQDQLFAACGGLHAWSFQSSLSCTAFRQAESTSERKARLLLCNKEFAQRCVLVFTGELRDAHEMAAAQLARVADNTALLRDIYRSFRQAVDLCEKNLTLAQVCDELGKLLLVMWSAKRALAPGMTTQATDRVVDYGLRNGATGAKLLGAGGGGFVLFIVPPRVDIERFMDEMRQATTQRSVIRCGISYLGSSVIINQRNEVLG